jgi:hypothetical protein
MTIDMQPTHEFNINTGKIIQQNFSDCESTYLNDDARHEFQRFFALKIASTNTEKMEAFLAYQLEKNFGGSKVKYVKFLDDTILAHQSLIKETDKMEKVKGYIEDIKALIPITEYSANNVNYFIKARIRIEASLEGLKTTKEKSDFIEGEILKWRNLKFKRDTRLLERVGIAYDKMDKQLFEEALEDNMPIYALDFDNYLESRREYFKDLRNGNSAPPNPLNPFDYSNKEGYFFDDKMKSFEQIENEMLQREFFKTPCEWTAGKNKLVAFIYILYKLHYLKPKGREKGKALLLKYRRFFEDRYKTDIRKAFQPSQFKIGTLKSYVADFHFILGIDNI